MNEQVLKAKEMFDQGTSLVDIAAALGVSPGTVRSWKSRYNWGGNAATQRNVAQECCNVQQTPKPDKKAKELAEPLTEKERLFCEIYVRNFNATQAAIKAGYSIDSARSIGYENLTKPRIRGYVEHLKALKKASIMIGEDDIVERYMRIAFADITDFVEFGRVAVPVMGPFGPLLVKNQDTGKKEPLLKEINEVRFKESWEVDGGLIAEVKQGKDGSSVKLQDRHKALDWLARYFEINPDDRHKRDYDLKRLELQERAVRVQEQKVHDDTGNDGTLPDLIEGLKQNE